MTEPRREGAGGSDPTSATDQPCDPQQLIPLRVSFVFTEMRYNNGLSSGVNEIMQGKHLAQCWAYRRCSKNMLLLSKGLSVVAVVKVFGLKTPLHFKKLWSTSKNFCS